MSGGGLCSVRKRSCHTQDQRLSNLRLTLELPTNKLVPQDREIGLNEAAASSEEAVRSKVKSSVVVVVESDRAMSSAMVSTAAIGMDKLYENGRDSSQPFVSATHAVEQPAKLHLHHPHPAASCSAPPRSTAPSTPKAHPHSASATSEIRDEPAKRTCQATQEVSMSLMRDSDVHKKLEAK